MKNGISLVILVVTIAVLLIITSIIVSKGTNIKSDTEYIRFEKQIEMVEKAIQKANLKNMIYGTPIDDISDKSIYEEISEYANNKFDISIYYNDFYILDKQDLAKLGISNINDSFLVNYKNNVVFSLKSYSYNNEIIYTTQEITDFVNKEMTTVEYNPKEGNKPNETNNWDRVAGYYKFGQFGLSSETLVLQDEQLQDLENPYIFIKSDHIYQRLTYELKDYKYSENSSMEIRFSSITLKGQDSSSGLSILLSDNEKAAQCLIGPTTFRVAPYSNPANNSFIKTGMDNSSGILKVIKTKNEAKYYLNDELLYTQTNLFDIENIMLNVPSAANNKTGFTWSSEKANSFTVLSGTAKIYSIKYMQW